MKIRNKDMSILLKHKVFLCFYGKEEYFYMPSVFQRTGNLLVQARFLAFCVSQEDAVLSKEGEKAPDAERLSA